MSETSDIKTLRLLDLQSNETIHVQCHCGRIVDTPLASYSADITYGLIRSSMICNFAFDAGIAIDAVDSKSRFMTGAIG